MMIGLTGMVADMAFGPNGVVVDTGAGPLPAAAWLVGVLVLGASLVALRLWRRRPPAGAPGARFAQAASGRLREGIPGARRQAVTLRRPFPTRPDPTPVR